MPVATIVPAAPGLEVNGFNAQQDYIIGEIESIAVTSLCPLCGMASSRIQNHYMRQVGDMPWGGSRVQLTLSVRKFFCDNASCSRKIFTERLPGVVRPYGRKTSRLEQALLNIGYAEGGESGARTADKLGMKTSPDTILRTIRRAGVKEVVNNPKVIGVDEFAFRRGHNYGTILIDLEKHERIDLLPDRNAETFAQWLKDHPGVEVITRDRSGIYANGATEGAPNATQVDDRFHLLKNLTEAVERLLNRHRGELQETTKTIANESMVAAEAKSQEQVANQSNILEPSQAELEQLLKSAEKVSQQSKESRDRRLARYQQIKELSQNGMSIRMIARQLGVGRNTVKGFLRADIFPERAPRKLCRELTAVKAYLLQRWEAGMHNSRILLEEIRACGFRGSKSFVKRLTGKWRKELFLNGKGLNTSEITSIANNVPSPRQTAFWLLDIAKEKNEENKLKQKTFVDKLCDICPEIKSGQELGREFIQMVRQRQSELLDTWLENTINSGIVDLINFAKGLKQDYSAVKAALSLPYSNGQTEGQVNRLKFIKRSMYGRAKFDLLKARVLQPT